MPISQDELLSNFPKVRSKLPDEYLEVYDKHYKENRNGETAASSLSMRMERWLHKMVAADTKGRDDLVTLEIGAGTLNQLQYEKTQVYDIVEPYSALYQTSKSLGRVRKIYADISETPDEQKYDRITSVACFEHICNLPEVVEKCCKLLSPGGCLRVSIPNEGRFLWKFAYTITTGMEFKARYHLDYNVIMKYEHVNTADEIEDILRYYFKNVKVSLLGISKDLAFYRYYTCRNPNMEVVRR